MLTELLYCCWVLGRAQFKPWGFKKVLKHVLYKENQFQNQVYIRMINLHRNIKEKYGLEAIQQLHLWEKNTIRTINYKKHRIFTLRWIGLNLIPVSIRLKPVRSKQNISASPRKIIEKAEKQLLQDRVRGINKTIQTREDQVKLSRGKLASMVTQVDLDRCTDFIEKVRLERFNQVKNRQVRKLHILSSKHNSDQDNNNRNSNNRITLGVNANRTDSNEQRYRHGKDQQTDDHNQDNLNNKWVINLTKVELTQTQRSLLGKGPNFAISPNNIPNLDYITAIETVCSKLKEDDADELRGEINGILKKGKIPKPNLNKEERTALNKLRKDKDRIILMVDKGVAMVVLHKEDYNNKAKGPT